MSEMAMLTRRFMPPEKLSTLSLARSSRPTRSRFWPAASRASLPTQPGHSPEEYEVVDCGQLRVEGELLWADADDLSDLVAVARDGVAADGDVAVVGLENGGEHSDGRGLACRRWVRAGRISLGRGWRRRHRRRPGWRQRIFGDGWLRRSFGLWSSGDLGLYGVV